MSAVSDLARSALKLKAESIAARIEAGDDVTAKELDLLQRLAGADPSPVVAEETSDEKSTPRRGRESAVLVAKYAKAKECSRRTAQRHRDRNTEAWREFCAAHGGASSELFESPWSSVALPADGDEIDVLVHTTSQAYLSAVQSRNPELIAITHKQYNEALSQRRQTRLSEPQIALRRGMALDKATVLRVLHRVHGYFADSILEELVAFGHQLTADPSSDMDIREAARERRDKLFRALGNPQRLMETIQEETPATVAK